MRNFIQQMQRTIGAFVMGLALLGPQVAYATPISGELFYTLFSGSDRVKKTPYTYDGTAFSFGSKTVLASGIGADGIAGNPNDPDSVLVAGQTTFVRRVSKTGAGVLQTKSTTVVAHHLEVYGSSTLFMAGIPGALGKLALNSDGSMGTASTITLSGDDTNVTQVITTPSGFFYTRSASGGFGNFGTLTFNSGMTAGTTTRLASSVPAAHGGVYDPFSSSIIIFGDDHISQYDLTGTLLADLDFVALGESFLNFDQGTVDGDGHIFAASNSGHLVFIDYSGAGDLRINNSGNFRATTFLDSNLDDIAPLIGAGSTTPVPEPSTMLLLGSGLAGLAYWRRRKRCQY